MSSLSIRFSTVIWLVTVKLSKLMRHKWRIRHYKYSLSLRHPYKIYDESDEAPPGGSAVSTKCCSSITFNGKLCFICIIIKNNVALNLSPRDQKPACDVLDSPRQTTTDRVMHHAGVVAGQKRRA